MNALAKLPTTVKPKPSKAEIIEALAILRLEEINKERKAAQQIADRLTADAENALFEWLRNNIDRAPKTLTLGSLWTSENRISGVELTFSFSNELLPSLIRPLIVSAMEAHSKIPREEKLDRIRDQIKKGCSPNIADRAAALIGNPEMRSALYQTLKALAGEA